MTEPSSPVRLALLGCTHPHSRLHLGSLKESARVAEMTLWDPDLAAAEVLAATVSGKPVRATDDLARALGDEVDLVLVCRRNDLNPDTCLQALQMGKPVLSEKPVARTHRELLQLRAAAPAAVPFGVYYPWRFHPAAAGLRGWIAAGCLGRLLATEFRMVTSQVRFRDPNHWLFSPDLGGGGILHWLGCHFVDLMRFLFAEEVVEVSALTGTLNGYPLRVEDTASITFRWQSGAIGTFTAGYHLSRSTAGYSGAAYDMMTTARGLDGRFTWHPTRTEEMVQLESIHPDHTGAEAQTRSYRLDPSDAYCGRFGLELLHQFLDAVRTGSAPAVSWDDALAVLAFVEAAYRSAESGSVIRLPDPPGSSG